MSARYANQSSWSIAMNKFYRQPYKAFQKITEMIFSAQAVRKSRQEDRQSRRTSRVALTGRLAAGHRCV